MSVSPLSNLLTRDNVGYNLNECTSIIGVGEGTTSITVMSVSPLSILLTRDNWGRWGYNLNHSDECLSSQYSVNKG